MTVGGQRRSESIDRADSAPTARPCITNLENRDFLTVSSDQRERVLIPVR